MDALACADPSIHLHLGSTRAHRVEVIRAPSRRPAVEEGARLDRWMLGTQIYLVVVR